MKRTREQRKNIIRACIIDASWYVFTSKGFKDATVREIAKLAGISTGSIYRHFGSKEKLAEFTAQNFYNQIVGYYERNIPNEQNLFIVLRIQSEIFIEFGETYYKLFVHTKKSKPMQNAINNMKSFLFNKFQDAINENNLTANANNMPKKDLFDLWFGLLLGIPSNDTANMEWDEKSNLKFKTIYKFISLIFEQTKEIDKILNSIQNTQYN